KSLEDEIEVGVVLTSERSMADEQDSNLFGEGEPKGEPTDESAAVTKAEKEEEVDEKKPKLNINTATFEELLDLPGIGKVLAQRIIEYRTEKGKFLALDELMEVRGIGEKLLERIKPYLTI
ncbi:MAG TPA: helix-hairpin-helix domain-containing protein, partial [Bacillota bacterium]|nr:helix-hairpin-helix domain-containing protein [Bacillota bacterium]